MAVDNRGRKLPKGIRKRSKNYEGRFTYQYKEYTVQGSTIAETQKLMRELKYKLEHGLYVQKHKMTYQEWFDTWLKEYKKNQVKLGTLQTYQYCYDSMIKENLGTVYISDIRGEHIQRLYNSLLKEGYEVSTISTAAAVLNSSFKQAVRNGLIEQNPVKAAVMPRQKGQKKIKEAMTKEQQALFMKYAQDSYLYNFFAVMLRTGMRCGEVRGLKYSDIDRKNRVIHVQRTLKWEKGQGIVEDTPKTKTSLRDIPLTDEILQLLDNQYKYWGFKVEKLDRYLFCDEKGKALRSKRIRDEIIRIVDLINKETEFPHISPHTFRHTFATRAIEAGMPPQVLKTILGHSSLAMTMDLYSHVMPDTKAMEMEKIAKAF